MTHVAYREAPIARVVQFRECTFKEDINFKELKKLYPVALAGEIVVYQTERRRFADLYLRTRRLIITKTRPTNPIRVRHEPILSSVPDFTYPGMRTQRSMYRQVEAKNNGRSFYYIVPEKFVRKPVKAEECQSFDDQPDGMPVKRSKDERYPTVVDNLAYSIPVYNSGGRILPNPVAYSLLKKEPAMVWYDDKLTSFSVDKDGIHSVSWEYNLEPFDKTCIRFRGYGLTKQHALSALVDHIKNFASAMSYTHSLAPPEIFETSIPHWLPIDGDIPNPEIPISFDTFVIRCSERDGSIMDLISMLNLSAPDTLKAIATKTKHHHAKPTPKELRDTEIINLLKEVIEGNVQWTKYLSILPAYLYMTIDKTVVSNLTSAHDGPVILLSQYESTWGWRSTPLVLGKVLDEDVSDINADDFGLCDDLENMDFYDTDDDSDPC